MSLNSFSKRYFEYHYIIIIFVIVNVIIIVTVVVSVIFIVIVIVVVIVIANDIVIVIAIVIVIVIVIVNIKQEKQCLNNILTLCSGHQFLFLENPLTRMFEFAAPTRNLCWTTTVTVMYDTNNGIVSLNHSQAITIMAEVLQIARTRLNACRNTTLKLGRVTTDTINGNASVKGRFEFHRRHFLSSKQERNTLHCILNASVFGSLLQKPAQNAAMGSGVFSATKIMRTSFLNNTCCSHGSVLVKTQCGRFKCLIFITMVYFLKCFAALPRLNYVFTKKIYYIKITKYNVIYLYCM